MKWVRHTLWQGSSFENPFLARVQVCGPCRCRWPTPDSGMQAGYVEHAPCVSAMLLAPVTLLPGRSFSEYQEAAQYLAGPDFPVSILEGVLKKASLPSKCVAVVNLTPYDAHLERVCLKQLGLGLFAVPSMFVCRCGWALASWEWCNHVASSWWWHQKWWW